MSADAAAGSKVGVLVCAPFPAPQENRTTISAVISKDVLLATNVLAVFKDRRDTNVEKYCISGWPAYCYTGYFGMVFLQRFPKIKAIIHYF